MQQSLIDDYQLDLASRLKAETVNSYLFKICPIVKFGMVRGYITEDIQFSHMAHQKHFKDIYTEDEIRKLLPRPKTDKFNEYRTWFVVNVFLRTGIRSLELRSIRCKDVNLNDGYITLVHTKNKEPRIVPLSKSLISILQEYMMIRNGADEDYLFCSIYGDMMGRCTCRPVWPGTTGEGALRKLLFTCSVIHALHGKSGKGLRCWCCVVLPGIRS